MPKKRSAKTDLTFARAPYFSELNNPDLEKRFNELPGWERHLIRRLVEHGDLQRAAQEAGVSRHAKDIVEYKAADRKSLIEALEAGGLTPQSLVTHLSDCLEARTVRLDKHGNVIPGVDLNLKLKAIELIMKARGDLSKERSNDAQPPEDLFEETPV